MKIEKCREEAASYSIHTLSRSYSIKHYPNGAVREFCRYNYSSKLVDFELSKREIILVGPE